jgi:ubiquinone/menaquinone biosynthesis C-methylase UbiE
MLRVAQTKLAGQAGLCLGDATHIPFPDQSFDLVQTMFVLHTLPEAVRASVVSEVKRVLRRGGRFLVIDYHVGPPRFLSGWLWKAVTVLIENLADREHTNCYRGFMASGGLLPLIEQKGLSVDKVQYMGGGTIGLYLLTQAR